MTDLEVCELAMETLERIEAEKPGAVWAGRPGITAGVHGVRPGVDLCFRRIDGGIRMEAWHRPEKKYGHVLCYHLPADLQRRASQALDRC